MKTKEPTYSVGNFFYIPETYIKGLYHLVACGDNEVMLSDTTSGLNLSGPHHVENLSNITQKELTSIMDGYKFNYVDNVTIKYEVKNVS